MLVQPASASLALSSRPHSRASYRSRRSTTKISPSRLSCRPSRPRSRRRIAQRWLDLLSPTADRDQALEFFDAMVPQGVTRVVVKERDRAAAAGRAAGRRLPPDRRSLHRDRRARPHRDVAPRHPPPARRRPRPPAVAHRRRGAAGVDRRPASPGAAPGQAVRGHESGPPRRSISSCGCRPAMCSSPKRRKA